MDIDEAVRMHLAVGTSLATIIPTSISSARAHHKRGGIDLGLLKVWGPAIFIGVIIGTILATQINGRILTAIFGIIALIVAFYMVFKKEGWILKTTLPHEPFRSIIGMIIGLISAMMGIGGGTLSVPILSLCAFPIRRAVGTASAIGLIIAIPAALGFMVAGLNIPDRPIASLGYVNIIGFGLIVPASILCAPIGVKIAHSIDVNLLRKAFALFLSLSALRMLLSILGS
jgi:uncharacterized membrane protein YfcA